MAYAVPLNEPRPSGGRLPKKPKTNPDRPSKGLMGTDSPQWPCCGAYPHWAKDSLGQYELSLKLRCGDEFRVGFGCRVSGVPKSWESGDSESRNHISMHSYIHLPFLTLTSQNLA